MPDQFAERWHQQRPARIISGPLLALIVLMLLAGIVTIVVAVSSANRSAATASLTAVESRFTLEPDNGRLTSVDRRSNAEVWYRVTLSEAPLGSKLTLHCDWIDPEGRIVHENHYETRVIDKKLWPTYARCRIGPEAPLGTWTARLSIEDRVLASSSLEVRDGPLNAEPPPQADPGQEGGF